MNNAETRQMGIFVLSSAFAVATAAYSAVTLGHFKSNLLGDKDVKMAKTLSVLQYVNLGFGALALLLALWVFMTLMGGNPFPDVQIPILSSLSPGASQMLQVLGFVFTAAVTVFTIMFIHKQGDAYKAMNKDKEAKTSLILNYIMAALLGLSLLATVGSMMGMGGGGGGGGL